MKETVVASVALISGVKETQFYKSGYGGTTILVEEVKKVLDVNFKFLTFLAN